MNVKNWINILWGILTIILFTGCGAPAAAPTLVPATAFPTTDPSTATPPPMITGGIWTTKADMPTGRWQLSTCVVGGKIYAIGGAGPTYEALSAVEVYDPATDTWTTKSPMPTARQNLTASVVNGKIYAIGGQSSDSTSYRSVEIFSAVEEYDPVTDTWTAKSPIPTARANHFAHVVNGKIYVFGGAYTAEPHFLPVFTIEVYDPATDTWIPKGEFLGGLRDGESSMVGGKIYFFGGLPEPRKVYEYDLATDTWTQKSDMPTARRGLSASALDGKIYVFGGFSGSGLTPVEVYDPAMDTWAIAPDMPTPRFGLHSSVVDGKIYIIGGAKSWLGEVYRPVDIFEP